MNMGKCLMRDTRGTTYLLLESALPHHPQMTIEIHMRAAMLGLQADG